MFLFDGFIIQLCDADRSAFLSKPLACPFLQDGPRRASGTGASTVQLQFAKRGMCVQGYLGIDGGADVLDEACCFEGNQGAQ